MKRILFLPLLMILLLGYHGFATQELPDPVKEAARKREKQFAEQNYKELKEAAGELETLSKELNDEVDKSSEHVVSARIFDKLDKIEKLTKKIRDKAHGPY
jgi:hypothetical protein